MADRTGPPRPQHCWVTDAPDIPAGRWPGLLLDWVKDDDGWSGRVVVAAVAHDGPGMVVQTLIPKRVLRPLR